MTWSYISVRKPSVSANKSAFVSHLSDASISTLLLLLLLLLLFTSNLFAWWLSSPITSYKVITNTNMWYIIYNRKRNKQKTKRKTHNCWCKICWRCAFSSKCTVPDTLRTKFTAHKHLAGQQILHGHPTLNILNFPSATRRQVCFTLRKGRTELYKKSHINK